MKKLNKINQKQNIIFGLLFFTLFLIIGLYPLKSGEDIRIWSIFISLIFLIISIIKPSLFTKLNKLWIEFGIILGKIISPIIMMLFFYIIITPTGLLLRIFGKDVMRLKKNNNTSYWIDRKDNIQSMKNQY
tara:strand:- start:28499 stop:28891 length:393 start_codon:yes stop_codon:yes gene_type:complete